MKILLRLTTLDKLEEVASISEAKEPVAQGSLQQNIPLVTRPVAVLMFLAIIILALLTKFFVFFVLKLSYFFHKILSFIIPTLFWKFYLNLWHNTRNENFSFLWRTFSCCDHNPYNSVQSGLVSGFFKNLISWPWILTSGKNPWQQGCGGGTRENSWHSQSRLTPLGIHVRAEGDDFNHWCRRAREIKERAAMAAR